MASDKPDAALGPLGRPGATGTFGAVGRLEPPLRLATAGALAAERGRWWLWAPVGVGLGIAVYFALETEPARWLGAGLLACLAPLGLVARRHPASLLLWAAALSLAVGFAAAQLRTHLVAAPVLEREVGPLRIAGQIVGIEPKGEGRGPRVLLQHLSLQRNLAGGLPARVRVRLTARDPAGVGPGDWIALPAVLRPPPTPAAPGAYDFGRQAYFQRLGAVGYAVGHLSRLAPDDPRITAAGAATAEAWRLDLNRLRGAITERIRAAIPGTPGALAAALVTGERAAIPEAVIQAMRDAGLAHLLAISGLHMGLVTGFLFFGLRALLALVPALALRAPIKKWAALLAGFGAFAYLLISGASVPTQRAFIMVLIVLTGVLLDRTAITLRLVAWAALVILLLTPESLLSASFQLSFAATTALVAGYELLRGRRDLSLSEERGPLGQAGLYVAGVAFSSVVAICATAPFAIYHFNRFALYGLIGNLLAVPLTAFWIMPAAVLGLLLMPFGLEGLPLAVMGAGVRILIDWAALVSAWPGASLPLPAMPPAGLAMVALGGLWLCLWGRRWRLLGLLPLALGLLSIAVNPMPDLLVEREARLFGLRDPSGQLWLSSQRRAQFSAEVWRRRLGLREAQTLPTSGRAPDAPFVCDRLGCIAALGSHQVAVVRDGRALQEDCGGADVVISLVALPEGGCPGPALVIDRWDLWHGGAHALYLGGAAPRVESVRELRGRRPWSGPGSR